MNDSPYNAIAILRQKRSVLESLSANVLYLALDEIRRDGGTQPRAAIDLKHVKLLEEQIEDGQELEPVTVFYDGESYWLADGYHRFTAHRNRGLEAIACVVRQGTRRDAVLYSVGANAENKPALPRSREDKRRAVMTLLQDPEWGEWSNYSIAKTCRVNEKTVRNLRSSLTTEIRSEESTRIYKTKHGTTATMATASIGKAHSTRLPDRHCVKCDSTAQVEDNEQKRFVVGDRITVAADHPLLPNRSGTISQIPNSNAAVVELDTGERELIALKYLAPATAQHLKLEIAGLVEIHAPDNDKIDGRVGRIATVKENNVEVWLRDVETMTMHSYSLKPQQLTPLPLEREPQLVELSDRIALLRSCDLDPFEREILSMLERPIVLTPTELEYLVGIERRYGIVEK
ncbi:MAG: hypothetical protein CLLPBCKN_006947 [Chroococcidiopsis cubana SAG 39.79]|uniref:ParB-like N-terminal domain-containing protein n=1 Tax=Chroococcidiopsis cubana SAG 39.79 TaxID=388085 RepID=A0AB37UG37_9CYAN|nr:ParB/RepB/Spo0J family partition protein [Chroococcidiopsis cubana]MDZ4877512.1 hypothetical protein [Chroococcidiopsis cubana SAG 39.79]RUT10555.1 hypothetical protein DSM107010_41220 [Chroococcidiopsis cubana SAG 39.79]